MGFASTADRVLSWIVPVVFLLSSIAKLYPGDGDIQKEMRRQFISYAPTCPTVYFGYTPKPETYQTVVGIWELFCGAALLLSRDLKWLATGILSIIMLGAIYTHIAIKDYPGIPVPTVLFLMCLFLHLRSQNARAEKVKAQ